MKLGPEILEAVLLPSKGKSSSIYAFLFQKQEYIKTGKRFFVSKR